MNRKKRAELSKAVASLIDANANLLTAREIIDDVKDQEQEDFDNMPESRQESDAGSDMEENVDTMEAVVDAIDEMIDNIEDAIDQIQEVIDK